MNKWNMLPAGILLLALSTSCEENTVEEPEIELQAVTVENLHAPGDLMDRSTGEITEVRPFRYFSLEDNQMVESREGDWDIGFKGTTLIVNSGSSGPGTAQASVVTGTFDEISTVPSAADFKSDGENGLAIPTGSGNGWYNYNPSSHIISPIPGRVLLIQTNEGNYAKMEILSYYQDNPPLAEVDPRTTPSPYFTFRYLIQPNGTITF
ncbi:HmuY family protein [Cyclobacterium salsum]|uniref:HmuY family protein n=1 Tax=Cyclobacterium salsum TaxID=2666329 RepID=UPI001391F181|nr:HmuY family protein [Cyclobacterium salsum]